jgi:hypothetical protein
MSANFLPCLLLLAVFTASMADSFAREIRGKPLTPKTSAATSAVGANTNATANPLPASPAKAGDYTELSFDLLANFTFEMPEGLQPANAVETKAAGQIPAEVKAFDQKKVALKGFMLPLKVDDGVVTEMLIMKDQSMCCYGAVPRINDWVSVKMKRGGVKSVMDQPVTLYGKLKVGEMLENGYLVGIYRMDGEKLAGPLDL